ncbi:MAG: sugar phosphate isomerase/epimerase [Anaerolineaceae bacterium]|nr:sugar phosphate isomerase/epimerase [Anaerolineaceae bacterium]MDE0328339.1 sugar phosphate isomerase/epimerase [Anaerolineaceae bacterium]
MARPVTLFTGQWADLTLDSLAQKAAEWGYDGLELACWGDHFEVNRALEEDGYLQTRHDILAKHGLQCFAISNHLVGQAVCDRIDARHQDIVPPHVWGDGDADGVNERAAAEIANTARAARAFGVDVVNGFTGSSVWHLLYHFPPTSPELIDAGYREFADRWNPILDVFDELGVRFGLEVHPTEIAYDIHTSELALTALDRRPAFGFNFDPSHFIHQMFDPVLFIDRFEDRIYHVHVKDSRITLNGVNSILSSHLQFGDYKRGWDFVSPGRGDVDFEGMIRALNRIGYEGPLSVEWEDSGMDREHGAAESVDFVRNADFEKSGRAFDASFAE